jgi:pimeloyl-ACP methyl ester carboxylesterase
VPFANLPDVTLHYALDGDGEQTVVLVNGLGDDLETWYLQVPDLLAAGYRVLRYDNRGIGRSSKPMGPYSSRLMADDAKGLVSLLGINDFHMVGVSMGGMIAQEYAIHHGPDLRSVTFGCTYAAPGPFCSRMFAMWEDLAPVMGVSFVMRDVTLWRSRRRSSPTGPTRPRSSSRRCGTSTSRCPPTWRSSRRSRPTTAEPGCLR